MADLCDFCGRQFLQRYVRFNAGQYNFNAPHLLINAQFKYL